MFCWQKHLVTLLVETGGNNDWEADLVGEDLVTFEQPLTTLGAEALLHY